MKENEVAISAGIRADIAESFMKNLKDVFVEHYVEVPEGKTDLVDELAEKLEESKASLDDEISKNIALNESNSELVREKMIRESSTGLSELEIEKFKTLTEEIEYSDEESFKTKLDVLKESYFKSDKVETDLEELNESADTKEVSPMMEKYLAAMRK
jgi:polyhydroxyalkanoate synthesis regulator phasin